MAFEYSGGLRVGASGTYSTGPVEAQYAWQTVSAVPLLLSDGEFDYVYGSGTGPVAQVDVATGEVSFLHGDVIGSTREVTDASGAVTAQFDYGMYGDHHAVSGDADATRFLFAGEYRDPAGMYYLRNREFDPGAGVFLSVDPVLSATGMPYAYTAGNPFQGTDPLGLYGWGDLWDGVESGVGAVWDEVSSPEFLASMAVGVGCTMLLGPAGALGCATAAGAVYSAVDYTLNTPPECQSLGGYFEAVLTGSAYGFATGVIAGPALRPVLAKVSSWVEPFIPKFLKQSVSSALQPIKNATQKLTTAIQSRLGNAANSAAGLLGESGTVNPSLIRFSQNSISSGFKAGGSVSDLAAGLADGLVSASDIPPIRLVLRDGVYYSLDNRRLWAFQQAGIDVPYRLATAEEVANEAWKFTTTNGGTSITVRGAR